MTIDGNPRSDLDPRWIAPIYRTDTGLDFLGLFSVQQNLSETLLPGIITITDRARYYSFYCWLLAEYAHAHPEGMHLYAFMRRREQIFGLANCAWTAAEAGRPGELGLLGGDKFHDHWNQHGLSDNIPLTVDDYLRASAGGYNTYAGVMGVLGLTHQIDPQHAGLTPRGQELALAFDEAIRGTTYRTLRAAYDTAPSITRTVIEEYGERCHLGGLASNPDRLPILNALFLFPQDPASLELPPRSMQSASLGLVLDMLNQARVTLTDDAFRRNIAYGLCSDHADYQPAEPLRPVLAHWRMYQLRSYYVYAIYALWDNFLSWLRAGPTTSAAYYAHLDQEIDLAAAASALNVTLPSQLLSAWSLSDWLDALLDSTGAQGYDRESRCLELSQMSCFALNEHALYWQISRNRRANRSLYAGCALILLSILYLRLSGLRSVAPPDLWRWAVAGGTRRRSLALFLRDIEADLAAGGSVLDVWVRLNRDYIVAQHTIAALEKWRYRRANTFHFSYEGGRFQWLRDDGPQFSASRFGQAFEMLRDLGLFEPAGADPGLACLTRLGQDTLQRVLEALGG